MDTGTFGRLRANSVMEPLGGNSAPLQQPHFSMLPILLRSGVFRSETELFSDCALTCNSNFWSLVFEQSPGSFLILTQLP